MRRRFRNRKKTRKVSDDSVHRPGRQHNLDRPGRQDSRGKPDRRHSLDRPDRPGHDKTGTSSCGSEYMNKQKTVEELIKDLSGIRTRIRLMSEACEQIDKEARERQRTIKLKQRHLSRDSSPDFLQRTLDMDNNIQPPVLSPHRKKVTPSQNLVNKARNSSFEDARDILSKYQK